MGEVLGVFLVLPSPMVHDKDPHAFCSCISSSIRYAWHPAGQRGLVARLSGSPPCDCFSRGHWRRVCGHCSLSDHGTAPCILEGRGPYLSPTVCAHQRGCWGPGPKPLHVLPELQSWQGVCGKVQHSRELRRGFFYFLNCFV